METTRISSINVGEPGTQLGILAVVRALVDELDRRGLVNRVRALEGARAFLPSHPDPTIVADARNVMELMLLAHSNLVPPDPQGPGN